MATITLVWDNTAVAASANATGQRASKRIKAIGGAFSTTGFAPANTLPVSATTTIATVIANRIHEFKVDGLCVLGGPTINSNGLKEQIVFECLPISISKTSTTISLDIALTNIDFTKVKYTVKLAADNTVVNTFTGFVAAGHCPHTFSALDPSTAYYIEVEYYTDIETVEVISSSPDYLNTVCGGNIAGYTVTTNAPPNTVRITNTNLSSSIDNVTGIPGFTFNTGAPIVGGMGAFQEGIHTGVSGAITIVLSGSLGFNPGNISVSVNGVPVDCQTITTVGTKITAVITATVGQMLAIAVNTSAC